MFIYFILYHSRVRWTTSTRLLTWCLGRPTMDGKTALGASSPAKPALHIPDPLSTTKAATSSSSPMFVVWLSRVRKVKYHTDRRGEWLEKASRLLIYLPVYTPSNRLPYKAVACPLAIHIRRCHWAKWAGQTESPPFDLLITSGEASMLPGNCSTYE